MKYLTILLLALFLSCSTNPETYTVEIIDGVRHVHNVSPLWGDENKIGVDFILTIGELEGENDNYILGRPQGAVHDSYGNIYISDAQMREVRKFDKTGRFLRTIGSEGTGPGEFRSPKNIGIYKDETLFIYDVGMIHLFDFNGKFIEAFRIQKSVFTAILMNSGNILCRQFYFSALASQEGGQNLAMILDKNSEVLHSFSQVKKYPDEGANSSGNFIYVNSDQEDNIFISYWYQNRIEKFSPEGKQLLSITRELSFKEDYKISKENYPDGRGGTREVDVANFVSFSTKGNGIDNKGRLWIPTYVRQPNEDDLENDVRYSKDLLVLEVYDHAGILLTRIPIDVYFKYFNVHEDKLYFVDDRYEVCVRQYQIVEK